MKIHMNMKKILGTSFRKKLLLFTETMKIGLGKTRTTSQGKVVIHGLTVQSYSECLTA